MKPLVLWRVKSIRNRIDKVYSSDKDPIHDMLLDLPHIVGTLSGYLGSPALRAAFTCSKMERLTGLWERLGELSQRPGAAPTPKTSLPTRLSHSSPGATCIVQRLRLIFCFTLCNLLSANVLIPNMWTFKDGENMTELQCRAEIHCENVLQSSLCKNCLSATKVGRQRHFPRSGLNICPPKSKRQFCKTFGKLYIDSRERNFFETWQWPCCRHTINCAFRSSFGVSVVG